MTELETTGLDLMEGPRKKPLPHPYPGLSVWLRSTMLKRATVCAMTSQEYEPWEFAAISIIVRSAVIIDAPVPVL